jgi:hypothetical protein
MLYLGIQSEHGILFLLLVLYRLIGSIFFLLRDKQSTLLLFPNLVEVFFIWAILLGGKLPFIYLPILIVLKEFQEYFLQIFWPNYLKKNGFPKFFNIFGVRGKVNWK